MKIKATIVMILAWITSMLGLYYGNLKLLDIFKNMYAEQPGLMFITCSLVALFISIIASSACTIDDYDNGGGAVGLCLLFWLVLMLVFHATFGSLVFALKRGGGVYAVNSIVAVASIIAGGYIGKSIAKVVE